VHHSDNDTTDWHLFSVRQNGVEPFVPLCLGGKHQPRAPVHLWLYYPWLVATQQAHERQPQRTSLKDIHHVQRTHSAQQLPVKSCMLVDGNLLYTLLGSCEPQRQWSRHFLGGRAGLRLPGMRETNHGRHRHTTNYNVTARTTQQVSTWVPTMLSMMITGKNNVKNQGRISLEDATI
jgi:hypothetical protein